MTDVNEAVMGFGRISVRPEDQGKCRGLHGPRSSRDQTRPLADTSDRAIDEVQSPKLGTSIPQQLCRGPLDVNRPFGARQYPEHLLGHRYG